MVIYLKKKIESINFVVPSMTHILVSVLLSEILCIHRISKINSKHSQKENDIINLRMGEGVVFEIQTYIMLYSFPLKLRDKRSP